MLRFLFVTLPHWLMGALMLAGVHRIGADGEVGNQADRHAEIAGAIGGAIVAALLGEWGSVQFDALGSDVVAALLYLIVIGSLVAYNIYTWLLRVAPFGLVSTYAYVNPVVAVLAGSIILSEPISAQLVAGAAVVVAGVAIMVTVLCLNLVGDGLNDALNPRLRRR